MIQTAESLGRTIGLSAACQALGVPRSSVYRARQPAVAAPRLGVQRHPSPHALSAAERGEVLATLNSERFQDEVPREVYATLLDEGVYLCSWRTMHRLLEVEQQVQERRNQLRHPVYTKPELLATGPNQLWSWDITKLKGPSGSITTSMTCWMSLAAMGWAGWWPPKSRPTWLNS